jgi:hypothetical protein
VVRVGIEALERCGFEDNGGPEKMLYELEWRPCQGVVRVRLEALER